MQRTEKLGYSIKGLQTTSISFFAFNAVLAPLIIDIGLNGLDLKTFWGIVKFFSAGLLLKVLLAYFNNNFDACTEQQLKTRANAKPTKNHTFCFFNNKSEVQRIFANIGLDSACFGLGLTYLAGEIFWAPSYNYFRLAAYAYLISAGFKGHDRNTIENFKAEIEHYQPAVRQLG